MPGITWKSRNADRIGCKTHNPLRISRKLYLKYFKIKSTNQRIEYLAKLTSF